MSYQQVKAMYVGAASGATLSSALDLGNGYTKMAVYVVTASTGALVTIYGSDTLAGTYTPIKELITNTTTVAYQSQQIPTANSGGWSVFNTPPFQYLKFQTSDVVSGGVSYVVTLRD